MYVYVCREYISGAVCYSKYKSNVEATYTIGSYHTVSTLGFPTE